MSIQNLYPNIDPTLLLDFANVKALDPRITFARASSAAYYDGYSTAKAEENLLLQSQTFETTWSTVAGGLTVTANTTTAPDGTATADTLTEDSGTSIHLCFQSGSVAGVATLSVFAKLGSGTRFLTIGLSRNITNHGSATFDLSLGTNTQTQANGTYSSSSATITAVAESFFRCTFTVTTDTATLIRIGLNDTGTPTTSNRGFGATYTGDGTSSLILWGAQLEARDSVTNYTPTTNQRITNFVPVLESAAAGEARFDHNPVTGESLGLLIEESRTNLILRSEEFDNAGWVKARSSIEANTVVAPDGTLTGDKLVENTETNSHALVQNLPAVAKNTTSVFSIYVKPAGRTSVRLQINAFSGNAVNAIFNLSDGTLISAFSSGTASGATGSIVSVGNGWYRCAIAGIPSATVANGVDATLFTLDSSNSLIYTGDGFSGLFLWGAQLEAGAFATSYIPTTTAQVTRSNDSAIVLGTNFSSWYRPDEGSAFCIFSRFSNNTPPYPVSFTGGSNFSASPRISLRTDNNVNLAMQGVSTSGSVAWNFSFSGGGFQNIVINAGISFSSNSISAVAGGNAVVEVTPNIGVPSGIDKLFIGANGALNGHIRKISYYPKAFQTQLQGPTV